MERLMYTKLFIVFTPNKEFSLILKSYMEVIQANERLTKVKEKLWTIKFDVFNLPFATF